MTEKARDRTPAEERAPATVPGNIQADYAAETDRFVLEIRSSDPRLNSSSRRKYEGFDSNRKDAKREHTARKGWCALFWWIFGESTLVASSELPLTPARHTRKGSG